MRIQPGLERNTAHFGLLSQYPGITKDGELIEKPSKIRGNNHFTGNNRNIDNLPSIMGDIGERIVHLLLPVGTRETGKISPYDLTAISGFTGDQILIEVKTAQMRNRGVIRNGQIARYMAESNNSLIYFAQLFYQMKSGNIPSKVSRDKVEEEFLPVCLYIFPISFVLYMVSTCQPCGHNPDTQFYAMTQYRAQSLYNLAEGGQVKNDDGSTYIAQTFITRNLPKNPEMPIRIIDHTTTPHILSHITPPPPVA